MIFRDGLGHPMTDEEIEQLEADDAFDRIMGYDLGLDGREVDDRQARLRAAKA